VGRALGSPAQGLPCNVTSSKWRRRGQREHVKWCKRHVDAFEKSVIDWRRECGMIYCGARELASVGGGGCCWGRRGRRRGRGGA